MYIDNLVEMHCHILPAIDDGSQNIETSLKMIAKLQSQGAKRIVLTPHYYSDTISLDDFLRHRDKSYNALERALPSGSPTLIPAAEVYISKYLFNYDNLDELCIANSGYALIEHPFSASFGEDDYNRLMNLYCDYGIKPVLAHIERYRSLMESKYLLDDYIEMGCLTQVNINSFDDAPRIVRKKLFKLLDSGSIHFIGSDCHNLDSRPPEYEKGVKAILKKSSQETLDKLINNANQFVK
jgi:protein-tyrosine phosphatase